MNIYLPIEIVVAVIFNDGFDAVVVVIVLSDVKIAVKIDFVIVVVASAAVDVATVVEVVIAVVVNATGQDPLFWHKKTTENILTGKNFTEFCCCCDCVRSQKYSLTLSTSKEGLQIYFLEV